MLPIWSVIFLHFIYSPDVKVNIPFKEIFLLTLAVVFSIAAGIMLQRKWPKMYNKIWFHVPIPTALILLLLSVMELYRNHFVFSIMTVHVFFMSAMLATGGFMFGAAMAFIARLPVSRILVIAIETGMRSSFLTCILIMSSLEQPDADMGKAGPTLWSFLTLAPALLACIVLRFYKSYHIRKYAATDCTDLDNASFIYDEHVMVESKETAI